MSQGAHQHSTSTKRSGEHSSQAHNNKPSNINKHYGQVYNNKQQTTTKITIKATGNGAATVRNGTGTPEQGTTGGGARSLTARILSATTDNCRVIGEDHPDDSYI